MNFGEINNTREATANQLPQDPRCSDSAFALANPGLCPNASRLILKPGSVSRCNSGTIQFQAFESTASTETRLTTNLTWHSSNTAVVTVNSSGLATIVAAGEAVVSVAYGSASAQSNVRILSGNCCADVAVTTLLLIDNSLSMDDVFNQAYSTKLTVAKYLAGRYANALDLSKDLCGVLSLNGAVGYLLPANSDADQIDKAIMGIGSSTFQTDLSQSSFAIQSLSIAPGDQKVLVIFSDFNQRPQLPVEEYERLFTTVQAFKDSGGIVLGVGIRAQGDGYVMLRNLSSAGFMLNTFGTDSVKASVDLLLAAMGYFCAASPVSPGYGYLAQLADPVPVIECELI